MYEATVASSGHEHSLIAVLAKFSRGRVFLLRCSIFALRAAGDCGL